MEETNFKDRLVNFAREEYDMGQARFEQYCGLPSGMINKIGRGISTVSLAKIARRCPELNLRWLLLGEGGMTSKGAETPLRDTNGGPDYLSVIEGMQRTIEALLEANRQLRG